MPRPIQLGDSIRAHYADAPAKEIRHASVVGLWRADGEEKETAAPTFRNMAQSLLTATHGEVAILVSTRRPVLLFLVRKGAAWFDVTGREVTLRWEK